MKETLDSHKNLVWFLKQYFRYQILGLEKLNSLFSSNQSFLLIGNHSINFIDPILLIHACHDSFQKVPYPIEYSKFFSDYPILNSFTELYNIIHFKDYKKISKTIQKENPILLYPGGLEEGLLRNFQEEPYKLKWEKNSALSRYIFKFKIPIVFVASLGTDELVTQSNTVNMPSITRKILRMSDDIYDHALQMWTVAIHPPIKITHIITDPIYPNEFLEAPSTHFSKSASLKSTQNLQTICQSRLDEFIKNRGSYQDEIDSFIQKFMEQRINLGL